MPINDPTMKPRGLAALSPERRREIAALGGKAAHAQGKAHRFTSQEAKAAGQRGGKVSSKKRKEVRWNLCKNLSYSLYGCIAR
jgi:general stress protein YciG